MSDLPQVCGSLRQEVAGRLRALGGTVPPYRLRRGAGRPHHFCLPRAPQAWQTAWNDRYAGWAHAAWQAGYLKVTLTPHTLAGALEALADAPGPPARPGLSLRLAAQLYGGLTLPMDWDDPVWRDWAWQLILMTEQPDVRQVRTFAQCVSTALATRCAPDLLARATLPVAARLDETKEELG